jgi:hypothetical protein
MSDNIEESAYQKSLKEAMSNLAGMSFGSDGGVLLRTATRQAWLTRHITDCLLGGVKPTTSCVPGPSLPWDPRIILEFFLELQQLHLIGPYLGADMRHILSPVVGFFRAAGYQSGKWYPSEKDINTAERRPAGEVPQLDYLDSKPERFYDFVANFAEEDNSQGQDWRQWVGAGITYLVGKHMLDFTLEEFERNLLLTCSHKNARISEALASCGLGLDHAPADK